MNHIRFIRFKKFSDRLLAPDIKAVVESTLKKMKMNSTVFMGVFAEDSNACYAATLTQIHTEVGSDKT